ncbi:AI-2E family transporter [uncultured Phascolarctobacterium sp.]|jgi:predicted PurR-regulated permease PerM|uniref:AI-2E family transporter n=1 Tax=uncultured Phascolarctobacterium sp. TaxID=512296 RepID=UPI0025ED8CAB|nr:AI-2E family transporter [uncultured Phascolarctobacterium sp.]
MQEKNPYGLLAFAIVLIWALWNYNASLHLLGGLYNILLPFIIGGCMAFIVNVLMTKLEVYWRRYLKHSVVSRFERPVCLLLSLVLIIGFLAFFVLTIVPELHASMKLLVKMLPPALAKLDVYLQQKAQELSFSPDELAFVQAQAKEIYHTLLNYLQNNKRLLLEQTVSATASLLDVLTNCVIGFVAAVYCLLEKHRLVRNFKRVLFAFCSKERAAYVLHVLQTSEKIFRGFVSGQLVVALLLGVMYFVSMTLFGFPYATVISLMVAVLSLIPILGTFISALIGCFLILVAAPEKIWYFIILYFVLQRVEGDLLYPKIVGKAVGLSELWVLAAVTIGASLGGIAGMIICVPLFSVLYALLAEKVKRLLEEKNLRNL